MARIKFIQDQIDAAIEAEAENLRRALRRLSASKGVPFCQLEINKDYYLEIAVGNGYGYGSNASRHLSGSLWDERTFTEDALIEIVKSLAQSLARDRCVDIEKEGVYMVLNPVYPKFVFKGNAEVKPGPRISRLKTLWSFLKFWK